MNDAIHMQQMLTRMLQQMLSLCIRAHFTLMALSGCSAMRGTATMGLPWYAASYRLLVPACVTNAFSAGWPRTSFWGAQSTTLILDAKRSEANDAFPASADVSDKHALQAFMQVRYGKPMHGFPARLRPASLTATSDGNNAMGHAGCFEPASCVIPVVSGDNLSRGKSRRLLSV